MNERYLIDSHVWVWHLAAPERIPDPIRKLIRADDSELALSMATLWELAIKASSGRLPLPRPTVAYLLARARDRDIDILAITARHIEIVEALPLHHRDPFDRMLVAQAIADDRTLISADVELQPYPVKLLLARS